MTSPIWPRLAPRSSSSPPPPTPYFSRHFSLKGLDEEGGARERRPSFQKSSWRTTSLPHLSPSIGRARPRPPNRPNGASRRGRPLRVTSTRRALSAAATCGRRAWGAAPPPPGAPVLARVKWCTGVATRCVGWGNNSSSVSELQSLRKHGHRLS